MRRVIRVLCLAVVMLLGLGLSPGYGLVARAAAWLELSCVHAGRVEKVSVAPGAAYKVCDRCARPFCANHIGVHRTVDPASDCGGWLTERRNPA